MPRRLLTVLIVLTCCAGLPAPARQSSASAAAAAPLFVAMRTARPPVLDGQADAAEWAGALPITRFQAYWSGQQPRHAHLARLLWDDDALYFMAELPDDYIKAHGTRRNDKLWLGDVFELFFKPARERPAYYELEVNPLGTILELPIPARGTPFETLQGGPQQGMTVAVRQHAAPAAPGQPVPGWTVEGRIPWTLFAASGGRPAPGATWQFHLAYYDYGPDGTEPELGSCALLTVPSYHRYEDFADLRFDAGR